jgi:homoserine/homoserine lactone efflux protein
LPLQLYLPFAAASVVLMAIPGPNVALIVAGSLARGPRFGLATVAGTSGAMVVQLALVALGMAQILGALGRWFEALRWLGVAYLVYLGLKSWFAPAQDLSRERPRQTSPRRAMTRGFLVSLTNPKTLFFYGAFFPQFVTPRAPIAPQLAILCASFLVIAIVMDSGWALAAGRLKGLLAGRGRLRNRLIGGALIAAGVSLAAARKSA